METRYEYDPSFNKLTFKKDAEGRETRYTIDLGTGGRPPTGDLLETLDAVGNRTTYAYDEHGQLQTVTDPRLFVTRHRDHDSFGNAREVQDPLGNVTTRTFDLRGRLTGQSDTMGHDTRQTWDGLDRLVRTVRTAGGDSDDEVSETAYYPGGEVRQTTNANGAVTAYTIDGLSRVVATETTFDGQTLTTATSWDANGNIDSNTDRRGVTRKNTYDALNRLVKTEIVSGGSGEGPIGQVAAYGYDLVGNKTSETDVNGIVTGFEYDGLYRLSKKVVPVINPQTSTNYEELYRHDKVGNLRRVTDANGKVTETDYDNLNRPTKVTRDLGGLNLITTTKYDDPEGSHVNKSEEHDLAKGMRASFTYDPLNRELTRTVKLEGEDGDAAPNAGPYTTTTAYEDGDHAVRITDPRGVKTLRKLDGLDRVFEETVDTDGLAAAPLSLITTVAYDGLGNRKLVTDPEGRETRFDYDALGRLLKATDANLQETSYSYFGDGLKASATDRRGVKKLFAYDNLGRPRKTQLDNTPFSGKPWSHETQYIDALQPKRIEIDARGKRTTVDLDGMGRVTKETDHLTNFRTFTWDGVNKTSETDKRLAQFQTRFEYDGINRLKKTIDPLLAGEPAAHTAETTYEDALNRVAEKDRRGTVKHTQMDPLGRVVKVTEAVGAGEEALVERSTWDGNGNRETQTDAEGHVTRFLYDAANRVSARTGGFGTTAATTTTYLYDKAGNLLEERDARAVELGEPWSVKRTYDDLNRPLTSIDGQLNLSRFGHDSEGNRDSTTTPKGQTTTTLHDELGKPLDITQPAPKLGEPSPVVRFRYDDNRNLVEMQDADGRVTKLEYDDLNRLFRTTRDPGVLALVSETTDFDADGRPLRIAEANGEATRQTWDELGRLGTRTHEPPAGGWTAPWQYTTEERNSYDPNSNLERVEERDVRTGGGTPPVRVTTRGYDRLDRLTSETVTLQDRSTKSVTTEYWKNGQVKSVTDAQGATSYTYDGQAREETVTTSAGITRKTYYPDSLVKDITFPNGTKRAHAYDKADRLLSIVTTKDAAPLASTAYTYDPNGNRLTQVQRNGGVEETTSYTYDDLDRLWTVTYAADAEHPNGRKVTYGHDGAGNRKTEVVADPVTLAVLESKTGVFDNANRLTELTDNLDVAQTTTLAWDRNGNLLSETKAGVTTTYRYDLRDTLAEVERSGQTLARFLGDFDERRVLKIGDPTRPGGSGVQEYVYNGSRLVLDVENGQPTARYEWTNEELVSLLQSGGGRRYFALDGLETVLALTDEQGDATDRLDFDAWGVPKEGTDFGTSGSRFAFTSHRFDTELNLYYAGGRMYSPTIGRFISQDTLSLDPNNPDTWNLFRYALANPTRYVDPTGHTAEGAELQGVLRETKDYFQSQAKGEGVTGFLKGVGFGILSGAVGIVESAVGLIDEGATVAYTVPGVDVMGDPTGVESREEIKQQVADLKQTYHVIKEEGFFNAASRVAGNAKDTLIAAAKGDPQAIAKVTSFATEIAAPTAALKGSGALGAMRRGAKELVDGAGRALRRGGDDLAGAGRRYQIGERLPDGRVAGAGPGAALRDGPDFDGAPSTLAERGTASGYRSLGAHPMDPNVPGGPTNYRGRYNAALSANQQPRLPADWDVHHSIPQQLRGDPRLQGLDIDTPSELRGVPGYRRPGAQTNVHVLMDQEWRQFLRSHPNATRDELLNFRDYQDWRFQHTFWESQAKP